MTITERSLTGAGDETTEGAEALASPPLHWRARAQTAVSGVLGTIAGITPHVLHHIGPIAGAAILTGTAGSVLFGAIGFALTIPLLIRLQRRFASWLAPGIALALFAVMFTVSTLWIGPAIRGESGGGDDAPHEQHHEGRTPGMLVRGEEAMYPWM